MRSAVLMAATVSAPNAGGLHLLRTMQNARYRVQTATQCYAPNLTWVALQRFCASRSTKGLQQMASLSSNNGGVGGGLWTASSRPSSRSKSLAALCGKGGVGKSTLLAQILDNAARFGLRTLGIDLDANGALSAMTGTVTGPGQLSIVDVLKGTVPPTRVALVPPEWQPKFGRPWGRGYALFEGGCVHILPAPQNGLEEVTGEKGTVAENRLHSIITESGFAENYDLIVVDVPGTEGPTFSLALNACQHILFPLQTESLAFRGFTRTIEAAIRFAQSTQKPVTPIGGVATMYKNNVVEHKQTFDVAVRWLGDTFGTAIPMLDPPIGQRAVIADAAAAQVPVSRMISRSGIGADISAGYSRVTLFAIASILGQERLDEILEAIDDVDLDDSVRSVIFGDEPVDATA
jgi:chromosome partitioning protein